MWMFEPTNDFASKVLIEDDVSSAQRAYDQIATSTGEITRDCRQHFAVDFKINIYTHIVVIVYFMYKEHVLTWLPKKGVGLRGI